MQQAQIKREFIETARDPGQDGANLPILLARIGLRRDVERLKFKQRHDPPFQVGGRQRRVIEQGGVGRGGADGSLNAFAANRQPIQGVPVHQQILRVLRESVT